MTDDATSSAQETPGPRSTGRTRGIALTHYAGRAGDHNDRAMTASRGLAAALAERLGVPPAVVGEPEPALSVGWTEELNAALPTLRAVAAQVDQDLAAGAVPVLASSRCAVALATLPVVARHRPDAVVVWFDAHADLNTPEDTTSGYLGGLAFSGPLGLWDSGLGAGLTPGNAVLVGARDIDPPEQRRIDDGVVTHVPVAHDLAERLRRAVAGRPVFVHVDCDVLDGGTVPTDYHVPGGPTLEDLAGAMRALAESEVVGVEVGELESGPDEETSRSSVDRLLGALEPLLHAVARPDPDSPADRGRPPVG
ncbi:arginase family protein [Phycicoccus flavus]|uniref:arginase family protein n=1 Tax=Phycicoccus flavus TaxID=2502783 RepID=UPI000FEB8D8B|nr:arginase family protein [Phycicoccus flavus]NHA68857.1 arginase family protein [Phycicoccus flavus]